MLLKNKTAVIYGAGGAVGGAVARAFAREGAEVFLAGRTLASVSATARDIVAAGGVAEAAQVDALDERAVEDHIATVARKAGRIEGSMCHSMPSPPFHNLAPRGFPSPSCRLTALPRRSRSTCDRSF